MHVQNKNFFVINVAFGTAIQKLEDFHNSSLMDMFTN